MGRSSIFVKGLKKGSWTSEEDQKLVTYIKEHGHGTWRTLPLKAGLQRCGKSCRLRWTNYLSPNIKRGKFSLQEEQTIIQLHALLGNRWSTIASHLPKRTDNEIKNYWNTHLKKRLTKMGIDPITHKSKTGANTNISHLTQWENVRLEAEARSACGGKVVSDCYNQRIHLTNIINKSSMSSILAPQPLCFDVLKGWQGINSCKLSSGLATLNDQTMPIVNVVESVEPQALEGMTTEHHMNDWKTSTEFFNTIENPNNTLEVSDMIFKDNYLAEASINHLVNGASNGNCHGDFEDNISYWRKILENLGHVSSFSSFF